MPRSACLRDLLSKHHVCLRPRHKNDEGTAETDDIKEQQNQDQEQPMARRKTLRIHIWFSGCT
jgi:hypothetical protein